MLFINKNTFKQFFNDTFIDVNYFSKNFKLRVGDKTSTIRNINDSIFGMFFLRNRCSNVMTTLPLAVNASSSIVEKLS